MSKFSTASAKRLSTCHPDLQRICNEAIKRMDFTVICGHRGQAEQDLAVKEKKSKTPWPKSKHNQMPSLAVDLAPFPIDWKDTKRFYELSAVVFQVAHELGIKIRWGADWNMNGSTKDEKFLDYPHYELML